MLDGFLRNLRVRECHIYQKHIQVNYVVDLVAPGTDRIMVYDHKSSFNAIIRGRKGDTAWVECEASGARNLQAHQEYVVQLMNGKRVRISERT